MSVYQGDFLGFQLGDDHSYGINITRVSTNDRYQDLLLPTFTDAVVQVPGGDGTYYWDTYYTQKPITINFAFDDLRDEDLRKLRQMFSSKTVKPLIFDEFPYKKYMVKCMAPPQLNYLCFDQYELRIYKGDGSVQFVAYYPFAFSVISPELEYISSATGSPINNVGDMPAHLQIIYDLSKASGNIEISLRKEQNQESELLGQLKLASVQPLDGDKYMMIDTRTQLIEGLDDNKNKTGNLYNIFIESGDFFYPPLDRSFLFSSKEFSSATYTPMYY